MSYAVLHAENCRYGVLVFTSTGYLRDIIEKPDFLTCSDGMTRLRDGNGNIIESMTRPFSAPVGVINEC